MSDRVDLGVPSSAGPAVQLEASSETSCSTKKPAHGLKRQNSRSAAAVAAASSSPDYQNGATIVASLKVITQQPGGMLYNLPSQRQQRQQQEQLMQQRNRQQQQQANEAATNMSRASAGELSCAPDPQNPYPQYAPVTFFYLDQTSLPRSWCLAIVSNKYPIHSSTPLTLVRVLAKLQVHHHHSLSSIGRRNCTGKQRRRRCRSLSAAHFRSMVFVIDGDQPPPILGHSSPIDT